MNPFSDERAAVLARLTPGRVTDPWSLEPGDFGLVAEVDRRIAKLERAGGNGLENFPQEDRPPPEHSAPKQAPDS